MRVKSKQGSHNIKPKMVNSLGVKRNEFVVLKVIVIKN